MNNMKVIEGKSAGASTPNSSIEEVKKFFNNLSKGDI